MKRSKNRRNSSSSRNLFPTAIKAQPKFSRVFRYQASSDVSSVVIYRENLLSLLVATTGTTTGYSLIESIKLDRICMWGSDDTTAALDLSEMSLTWNATRGPANRITSMGTNAHPAHISSRPPKDTSAEWWSLSDSNENEKLFQVVMKKNSIIDIHVTFVLDSFPVTIGTSQLTYR